MKITIGNKIFFFTEAMLEDTEDGNIPAAVERAFCNGKAVKLTIHNFEWEPETKTREMIVYAPNTQAAKKIIAQMKKTAGGESTLPKNAPAIWQEIATGKGTIFAHIEKFYQIKGDWYSGKTSTQIR